jgi:predicted aspartyl protease
MEGVIDTGFTDYLTVPPELLPVISWCFDEFVEVILADGSVSTVEAHKVTVLWDGAEREVAAFAMRGGPLVGMSMLQGSRVTLDVVDGGAVSIDVLK